ncbi:MAG: ROK family protein, partial [Planctomycetes bacterium]|nr:ROK family protein [Planctomycetota bacterium]
LLGGARGNGAELGHMIVHPGGRECSCGQRGCLEAYASASHTVDRMIEALEKDETSSLMELHRRGKLDCKDIFDHARRGDPLAKQIVKGNIQALALAMVTLGHIFENEMCVLAGGLVQAGEILTKQLTKTYQELVWHIRAEPVEIRTGQLGIDAGMFGAAGLARKAETAGTLHPPGT